MLESAAFSSVPPAGPSVAIVEMAEQYDRIRRLPQRGAARRRSVHPRLTRAQGRLLVLVRKVGEPVLHGSRQTLPGRLDAASTDPALTRASRALASSIDLNVLQAMSLEPVAADLAVPLGSDAADIFVRGMRYEIAVLAGSINLVAQLTAEQGHELAAAVEGASGRRKRGVDAMSEYLRRLLYDPGVPLTVSEGFATARRGTAAAMGILFALMTGRRLANELAVDLAQAYMEGMHAYARLVASLPMSGVAEEIIPQAERYDFTTLERSHHLFWQRVATGEQSFGTPDDDG